MEDLIDYEMLKATAQASFETATQCCFGSSANGPKVSKPDSEALKRFASAFLMEHQKRYKDIIKGFLFLPNKKESSCTVKIAEVLIGLDSSCISNNPEPITFGDKNMNVSWKGIELGNQKGWPTGLVLELALYGKEEWELLTHSNQTLVNQVKLPEGWNLEDAEEIILSGLEHIQKPQGMPRDVEQYRPKPPACSPPALPDGTQLGPLPDGTQFGPVPKPPDDNPPAPSDGPLPKPPDDSPPAPSDSRHTPSPIVCGQR